MKRYALPVMAGLLISIGVPGAYAGSNTEVINVISATYGENCGAAKGNVTSHIAGQCNGASTCRYTVNYRVIGDPAYGCAKTYTVEYQCSNDSRVRQAFLKQEAGWGDKAVVLNCEQTADKRGITVISATYGENCGAVQGNVTSHIAGQCNGKSNCRYTVNYRVIGDPARGCAKTYTVQYRCGGTSGIHTEFLKPEAGWGDRSVVLKCGRREMFK